MTHKIGIIGGSGLENPTLLQNPRERDVNTPWGAPSSSLLEGEIAGVPVALLARHGREHTIPPSQVNYRANIQALKDAGCTRLLVSTAVGSLREEVRRGDLVLPDQFIDFTRHRCNTFHESFAPHLPVHAAMPDPFDPVLRAACLEEMRAMGCRHHARGTLITIEGPRFSTRAESRMYRILGADIVNMSVATEAALANEAGLPYAAIAMSTDYDSWKDDEEPVTWEAIAAVAGANAEKVLALLLRVIPRLGKMH